MKLFTKILTVSMVLAVTCFFLMMGSFFKMITAVTGGDWENNPDMKKAHVSILNIEGPIISSRNILSQIERLKIVYKMSIKQLSST